MDDLAKHSLHQRRLGPAIENIDFPLLCFLYVGPFPIESEVFIWYISPLVKFAVVIHDWCPSGLVSWVKRLSSQAFSPSIPSTSGEANKPSFLFVHNLPTPLDSHGVRFVISASPHSPTTTGQGAKNN